MSPPSAQPSLGVGPLFLDRRDGGKYLASALAPYAGRADVIVFALPRGGVPVGYEVARALGVPLDIFIVRKLGFPGHAELAMGAIASGGFVVLNDELLRRYDISQEIVARVAAREAQEIARREREYRSGQPPLDPGGKVVILVDDGLATGATMRAAVEALRAKTPSRLVVAVPVAAPSSCEEMEALADEVVCAATPSPFHAVGIWYEDFDQVSDVQVCTLLAIARSGGTSRPNDA
jgi:predicted phosphoribosyltransferase